MTTVNVDGKSLQMALLRAAGQLGIAQDQMDYKVVKESNGFMGFGKKIVIEAWVKTERKSNGRRSNNRSKAPSTRPINTEKRELTGDELSALETELREFCVAVMGKVVGESVEATSEIVGGRLIIDIDNDSLADVVSEDHQLIEAMEHLLRKKPRHLKQVLPFRVFIDVQGTRQAKEKELAAMAHEYASAAHERRQALVISTARTSYERKVIHMALENDDRVYTKSIGSGSNRKLKIVPVGGEEMSES